MLTFQGLAGGDPNKSYYLWHTTQSKTISPRLISCILVAHDSVVLTEALTWLSIQETNVS